MELKAGKDCDEIQLEALAEIALQQINDRQYQVDMNVAGVDKIFKYCVAFCGKSVKIATE